MQLITEASQRPTTRTIGTDTNQKYIVGEIEWNVVRTNLFRSRFYNSTYLSNKVCALPMSLKDKLKISNNMWY